jgi:hypothetical protein
LTFQCDYCRTPVELSARTLSPIQPDLKQWVVLCLVQGKTFDDLATFLPGVSKTNFYRTQRSILSGAILCLEEHFAAVRHSLASSDRRFKLMLNGGWSHRGFKARQMTFIVKDFFDNTVLCCIPLRKRRQIRVKNRVVLVDPGNFVGSSKNMELRAFLVALQQLRDSQILEKIDSFVADGDATIGRVLRDQATRAALALDPGHLVRNLLRSLISLAGQTKILRAISYRIGKFLMRLIKRATSENRTFDEFLAMAAHIIPHYTRAECPAECPCNQYYTDEPPLPAPAVESPAASLDAPADADIWEEELPSDDETAEIFEEESSDSELEYDSSEEDVVDQVIHLTGMLESLSILATEEISVSSSQTADTDTDTGSSSGSQRISSSSCSSTESLCSSPHSPHLIPEVVVGAEAFYPQAEPSTGPKRRIMPKNFLNTSIPAHKVFLQKITPLVQEASRKAKECMSGLHTCAAELEHRRRLKWLPKSLFFSLTYPIRSLICSAVGNRGFSYVYQLLLTQLGSAPHPAHVQILDAKDQQRARDHSRRRTMEHRLRTKSCQAARIMELGEEKEADKQDLTTRNSYKERHEKVLSTVYCKACGESGHQRRTHRDCKFYTPRRSRQQ